MIYKQDFFLDSYIKAALDKKLEELVVLDVREQTSIADYFIICSGLSNRQVRAVAESIYIDLKKIDIKPLSIEGQKEGCWVIMDYGHVIIHIFYKPLRILYDLESLWVDAKRIVEY